MELPEIRRIVELMNEHGLSLFDLSKKDFHLKLKKGPDLEDLRALIATLPSGGGGGGGHVTGGYSGAGGATASGPPAAAEGGQSAAEGTEITSPMVGTFYRRPEPDQPTFVEVGTTVSEGQTLCIIEAMKVMNEIKAERAGTICMVVAEDSSAVQYGDVLFRIK